MIDYYLLTKPGIVLGNLVPFTAGFLLASQGEFSIGLYFATLLGLALIMASACVSNNYIDRDIDQKMERTKKRALVTGAISGASAILFALFLAIAGGLTLYFSSNLLAAAIAAFGYFVYIVLYSLWKRHTIYGTAIGSVAGATPPVVGYCAVSNQLDLGALILFAMLVLWQMPHFFAIALYRFDDYVAAKIPVLPIIKGPFRAKIHMLLYIVAFIFVAMLLTFFGYTGALYLAITSTIGLIWLTLSLFGFIVDNDALWGKQMFHLSLWTMVAFCVTISLG